MDHQNLLCKQIANSSETLVELKTRAEGISNITNAINQLADQTNMLALNAAIEAGRVSEQGKGHAVAVATRPFYCKLINEIQEKSCMISLRQFTLKENIGEGLGLAIKLNN